jgi:hypothetical protein
MPDVPCPHCQRLLRLPAASTGRMMRCPACQQTFAPETAEEPVIDLTDDQFIHPPAEPEPFADLENDRPEPFGEDRGPLRRPRRRWEDRFRYRRPHRGGLVLTLGILGLVFFPALLISLGLSITALCLANVDLGEMDRGRMDPSGRGATAGGKTCAILGIVFTALAFPVLCLLRVAVMNNHSHY